MRSSTLLRLIALCLVAASTASAYAQPRPPEPKKPLVKQDFIGFGVTVKTAEDDALDHACDWLVEKSNLGWPTSADLADKTRRARVFDFLRERNMVRFGEAEDKQFDELGTMKVVKMDLEISTAQGREIQKQAQQQRMKSRQGISLLVVLGIVGVLAVVGGYLRLEEATKGYYTRLLRVAAIGVLILVVAGLCMVA